MPNPPDIRVPNLPAATQPLALTDGVVVSQSAGTRLAPLSTVLTPISAATVLVLSADVLYPNERILVVSAGDLTLTDGGAGGNATLGLPDVVVGAAATLANITVDNKGRVTAIANGSAVTSIDIQQPAAGITVTGGPITSSGTFVMALANDLAALEGLATTGLSARTAADTWALRSLTQPAAGITITNSDGVAGNPTFALANDLAAVEGLASTGLATRTAADTWTVRTLSPPAAGITITNPAGIAGNPTFALANDLAALEGLGSTGIAVRTAADTWAQRTLQPPAAGITITNPAGVAGDPTFVLANDLAGLEGLSGVGLAVRTATDTWANKLAGEINWGGTTAGTANAQTMSLSPAPTAYASGMFVAFKVGVGLTNTGATTLNVNSLGAKNLFVNNAACVGGELVAGLIQFAIYDGTQFQLVSEAGQQHGNLIGIQVFTTPGASAYTPTAGTNFIVVEVTGAGGGGGGCALTGAAQVAVGGGGGGGGYGRKKITSGFAGTTVTVGAKGTGGTAGANAGTNGGTSSFGAVVSCTGGNGGGGAAAAAVPVGPGASGTRGSSTGGDINITAGAVPFNILYSNAIVQNMPGSASGFHYGGGGPAIATNTGAAGIAATGYGGGGAGGANAASQGTGKAGGGGTDGLVIIWEYA